MNWRIANWILLCGVVVLSLLGGPETVLCVSPDGHVVISRGLVPESGSCCHGETEPGESAGKEHCGGCIDLELNMAEARLQETGLGMDSFRMAEWGAGPCFDPSRQETQERLRTPITQGRKPHPPPMLDVIAFVRLLV
jgi:hypothetical protein